MNVSEICQNKQLSSVYWKPLKEDAATNVLNGWPPLTLANSLTHPCLPHQVTLSHMKAMAHVTSLACFCFTDSTKHDLRASALTLALYKIMIMWESDVTMDVDQNSKIHHNKSNQSQRHWNGACKHLSSHKKIYLVHSICYSEAPATPWRKDDHIF